MCYAKQSSQNPTQKYKTCMLSHLLWVLINSHRDWQVLLSSRCLSPLNVGHIDYNCGIYIVGIWSKKKRGAAVFFWHTCSSKISGCIHSFINSLWLVGVYYIFMWPMEEVFNVCQLRVYLKSTRRVYYMQCLCNACTVLAQKMIHMDMPFFIAYVYNVLNS